MFIPSPSDGLTTDTPNYMPNPTLYAKLPQHDSPARIASLLRMLVANAVQRNELGVEDAEEVMRHIELSDYHQHA